MRNLFLLAALLAFPCAAAELEGVKLEDQVRVDGQGLQLNGMALRIRYFFKVYVAGLYLAEKASTAQGAYEVRGAKRIVLVMMRDATADQFCESVETGLRINHSGEQLASISTQTDALMGMIRAAGVAKTGTRIVLDFLPSVGATTLFVDGAVQGPPLAGEEFYRALLRIWLGERPAQEDLKQALLGQPADNWGARNDH